MTGALSELLALATDIASQPRTPVGVAQHLTETILRLTRASQVRLYSNKRHSPGGAVASHLLPSPGPSPRNPKKNLSGGRVQLQLLACAPLAQRQAQASGSQEDAASSAQAPATPPRQQCGSRNNNMQGGCCWGSRVERVAEAAAATAGGGRLLGKRVPNRGIAGRVVATGEYVMAARAREGESVSQSRNNNGFCVSHVCLIPS